MLKQLNFKITFQRVCLQFRKRFYVLKRVEISFLHVVQSLEERWVFFRKRAAVAIETSLSFYIYIDKKELGLFILTKFVL